MDEISVCKRISPVSMPSSMTIVVTPVVFSPFRIAQAIGAAPRYLGNREAWTLIAPHFGICNKAFGKICNFKPELFKN
jgi:hypothetical protein